MFLHQFKNCNGVIYQVLEKSGEKIEAIKKLENFFKESTEKVLGKGHIAIRSNVERHIDGFSKNELYTKIDLHNEASNSYTYGEKNYVNGIIW